MHFTDKQKNGLVNMTAAIMQMSILLPISYPLDSLKSRMQMGFYKTYNDFFSSLNNYEHNKSLFRGFPVLFTGLVIRQPMKMVTFEAISNPFYASIFTACSSLIIGIPLSFIKTNYQTNNNFKLNWNMIKSTNFANAWHYEIAKESVGNIAFFTLYGTVRKYNNFYGEKYVDAVNFINGTLSSIIATSLSYPLDLMKVRKQTIQRNETFKQIFKSVGYNKHDKFVLLNFWKGSIPLYLRVSVFGGAGMVIYEKIKIYLNTNFIL